MFGARHGESDTASEIRLILHWQRETLHSGKGGLIVRMGQGLLPLRSEEWAGIAGPLKARTKAAVACLAGGPADQRISFKIEQLAFDTRPTREANNFS